VCAGCGCAACQTAWRLAYIIGTRNRRWRVWGRTAETHLFCRVHDLQGTRFCRTAVAAVCAFIRGHAVRHHMLWWDWLVHTYIRNWQGSDDSLPTVLDLQHKLMDAVVAHSFNRLHEC